MIYRLSVLALTLLFAFLVASPGLAQQGTEQFSTEETDRLSAELEQAQTRFNELQAEEDAMVEPGGEYDGDRANEINEEQSTLQDQIERASEDLAYARLEAIQQAPTSGTDQERIAALEDKRDALEALEDWSADNAGGFQNSDAYFAVTEELAAIEERIAEIQQPQSSDPAPSDGGAAPESNPTDPITAVVGGIIGLISFVMGTIFLTAINLLVMFAAAWRGQGSASLALHKTVRLSRVVLAVGVAILLGLLNVPFLLILIGWIVAYFILKRRARRAGGAGGAMGRTGSWFPRGPSAGGGSSEPDEGRRGRNVAGAKGEARVNPILASLTQHQHCYVFANLHEQRVGNIDHIVIGQAGAVIVETKANSGKVVLDDQGTPDRQRQALLTRSVLPGSGSA